MAAGNCSLCQTSLNQKNINDNHKKLGDDHFVKCTAGVFTYEPQGL